MFNIVEAESNKQITFTSINQLECELQSYVNWFGQVRIHRTLDY
ncbi:IS3 family transposase [Sporosarcina sp. P1]|nr:hypothetical protein CSV73_08840 [Sporosarcina sp. P1]